MNSVHVKVTRETLDVQKAQRFCTVESSGAMVLFLGTVRNQNGGKEVHSMTYDGHVGIAENILREITAETMQRHGSDLYIFIEHALGHLKLQELSLIIGVSSPHREQAYLASRYIIEEIKKRLPIWKEEHYVEGPSLWLGGESLIERGEH